VTHNFGDALDDHPPRRRGRGQPRRAARHDRARLRRGRGGGRSARGRGGAGPRASGAACAADEHRGRRERHAHLHRPKHPKSFVTLDDADHLISRGRDAEYAAGVIASWAQRYLDLRPPAPPPGAPEGVTRVSEADPDGFLQDIMAGPKHHVLGDEPKSYGGTDRGLTPYQFLAAGLGACTSMTVRMYARRKGWPLDHISVDVTHDKVHAQDAGNGMKPLETFTRVITLEGER
jgi:uncharacterized OsmC-like protein